MKPERADHPPHRCEGFQPGGRKQFVDLGKQMIAQTARHLPPPVAKFICPMSRPGLFRKALAAGHRTGKVLSCMSLGGFTPTPGARFPSIQC